MIVLCYLRDPIVCLFLYYFPYYVDYVFYTKAYDDKGGDPMTHEVIHNVKERESLYRI